MANVKAGSKVRYTGAKESRQDTAFTKDVIYEVENLDGYCMIGAGLSIVGSPYCMVHGNYELVEE